MTHWIPDNASMQDQNEYKMTQPPQATVSHTTSWTNFGVHHENRARSASSPNPGSNPTGRPSLRLHIANYNHKVQQQQGQHFQQQRHQQYQQHPPQNLPMSVVPPPIPPPRPDLHNIGHKQSHQHHYPLPFQNDRRLPLPHVPAAGAASNHRGPDLHAQTNSRSPSPRNTAITGTPSTGTPGYGGPSPFTSTPSRAMSNGNSTPSTGSSSSSKRGQLPFSTPSGSSSSPNLNTGLPVVEEYSPSPQLPGSAVGGISTGGGAAASRRPLPVPPPSRPASRNANPSGSIPNHTPIGPRVNSPLRSAPARATEHGSRHGHGRSRSDVELSLEHVLSGPGDEPDPPDPVSVPYHERSEKWKGKQKMRDLPPSPTSPRSPTVASPKKESSSPVFMSSAFPTNAKQTRKRSPERSPSLPALNTTYLQQEAIGITIPNPGVRSATIPNSTISPSLSSGLPSDHANVGVDLPASLRNKTSLTGLKSTVTGGGINKRTGIRRSGSVSSIRSNSSWRSSKSGHSMVSGWAGKVFGSGNSAKQEQSHSANSSPIIPAPTPTNINTNGMFNYDSTYNNNNAYPPPPSSTTTPTPQLRQPPTPRLQIPTTPSFVPPLPPPISQPSARSPLPAPPPNVPVPASAPVSQPNNNALAPAPTSSRRNTKHNKYFVANRTSMESIASLAVSVQQQQPEHTQGNGTGNRSVDSFSSSGSSGSGSGSASTSGGSGATVDADALSTHPYYPNPNPSRSQDSLYSTSTGPSTPTYSYSSSSLHDENDIGHAHEGYEVDDDRVYVDDGYDGAGGDLNAYLEDIGGSDVLEDLGEFKAAPGSPEDESDEFEGGGRTRVVGDSLGSGLGAGRRRKGEGNSPLSPMTYARSDESDSEALGGTVHHPRPRVPQKGRQKEKEKQQKNKERSKEKLREKERPREHRDSGKGKGKALPTSTLADAVEEYVSISGGRKVSRSTTNVGRTKSPSSRRNAPPPPPKHDIDYLTGVVLDDPADILGGEEEMVFAKHTSSSRRERGQSYVLGLGGIDDMDDDEGAFGRGKLRMRSRSPDFDDPLTGGRGGRGLRRYQSDERVGLGGNPEDDEDLRAHTLPIHAIEAPTRLTPNRYIRQEPLPPPPVPPVPAVDAHQRTRSHHGHSSISIPHNHNQNKPLPSTVLNFDYSVPASGGAFIGVGGLPGPFPFLGVPANSERGTKDQDRDRDERHSLRSSRSSHRSKSGASIQRGLSMPGREPGKEQHVRKQLNNLAPKPVSYELWVQADMDRNTPAQDRKKGVLTKPQI
ncbi:hypothetical protein PQX77_012202 [Marasmius sp. AFHP31]|nr:hypothetical protein PQX77_012202 [Marasmius sp. AFHP31]